LAMSSGSASIVGNITGGSATSINLSSTASLSVTGNILPGTAGNCIFAIGSSSVTVTGNCTGGTGANSRAIFNQGTGVITITGNCTGGGGTASHAIFADAASTISVVGEITASTSSHGISSTNASAVVKASGSFISAVNGRVAVYAPIFYLDVTPALAKTRYALDGTGNYVDMFTADNSLTQAAPADVRSGTVYADGNLTGTLAVPAAASVAFGVPVDATTGTAALDLSDIATAVWSATTRTLTAGGGISAEDVWTYATREITGGTVDTLVNAPTVPTAEDIATEVWDTPTSGLTTSGAIGTRLKNSSTVATTGSQLAAALS